jgi:hypothetical protein
MKKPPRSKRSRTEVELIDLSPEEVRRLPKPREGFDAYAETLIDLYENNVEELSIKGYDASQTRDSLAALQSLKTMESAAKRQLALVQETRLYHMAIVWTAMLDIYARAQSAGRNNPTMKRAIAEFEQFMKNRSPKKKPPTGPPPTGA